MLKNIGSNWLLLVLGIAATYFLTPLLIRSLGQEGYGTWTVITAFTGYISLLALGVPMASVRYLAQDVAARDTDQINRTVATCVGLYLILGVAALVVGTAMTVMFASFYDLAPSLQPQALAAFGVMVIYVSAGFIGLLPEGIMFAHHDFVVRNVIRMAGVLLRLGLTVLAMTLGASLIALASIQLVFLAFDFGVSWLVVRRRYPGVRMNLRDFDRSMMRRIFSFSMYVLVLNAAARLIFETDALVIGAFMGVAAVPFYVVANSLVVYLMDFIVAIAAVVSPMATKLNTQGDHERLRAMFLKWSKVALSITMMAGLFLAVFGPGFIGWWIDPSFEEPSGQVLQILVISSLVFLPIRGVALPILMGIGKPKAPTIAFAVAGVLNLALSIILVRPYGLAGVAIGTAVPNVLFSLFVLAVACRELDIAPLAYLKYVVPRAALGALPVLALLLWFRLGLQVQTISGLIGAGSAMVIVFGVVWVFFVYRHDPYVDMAASLGRFRVWSRV
ncbi:MAG TPA: oligosaccharide flippase family protein [Vicinamibacterales bacterium]|nr:oligosaccharide flippase family protein [Vicinamibacterales bacterium]